MAGPRVFVIGAGPTGARCAETLVAELLATGQTTTPIDVFDIGRVATAA
jgi:hypothetical protein